MEMSKSFVCCERCFNEIGNRSGRCVRLWMDLCAMYCARGGAFDILTPDLPYLRMLERLGFVISTENDYGLLIKVLGYCISRDGEPCFCIKGGRHE